jgi:hypothetical protein
MFCIIGDEAIIVHHLAKIQTIAPINRLAVEFSNVLAVICL